MVIETTLLTPFELAGYLVLFTQKEAKEFLEKEWNAQFWSRTTSLTEEEYFEDDDNWDRAMKYGYDVVNTARGFPPKYKKELEGEEEAEDDDDDEDEEEDEPKEADTTTSSENDATSVTKPTKTGSKTDVDVSKVHTHIIARVSNPFSPNTPLYVRYGAGWIIDQFSAIC